MHNYVLQPRNDYDSPDDYNSIILLRGQMLDLFYLQSSLRTCLGSSPNHSCVCLYESLFLYEESIQAALLVDILLAKKIANLPQIDLTARKQDFAVF